MKNINKQIERTNYPQEMGYPRWEMTNNEMGRRIYHRKWNIQNDN